MKGQIIYLDDINILRTIDVRGEIWKVLLVYK